MEVLIPLFFVDIRVCLRGYTQAQHVGGEIAAMTHGLRQAEAYLKVLSA